MLRTRKPWIIPACLFVYTTAMFIWLLPNNHEASTLEKIITVIVAYVIIAVLYFLLKKKAEMAKAREEDITNTKKS
ncbi:MAG: hypothetical protein Q4D12_03485 [Bacteroidales bacterium]|nr:hypothetical protein [Bacteroidales bacterium]